METPCPKETRRALLRQLLRTAWPSTAESFFTAFIQMVDVAMVGVLGTSAIAAVGLTAQPRMVALVPFMALQLAVAALVARRKGQGDREEANRILRLAVLLALALAIVVGIGGVLLAEPILALSGSQPDTHADAAAYFRIVVGGIAFQAAALTINAAQRGCSSTRIAFTSNMTSNLVNVAGNYLLIEGRLGFPALGVKGAAIATVFGTAVALLMSLLSVCRPEGYLNLFLCPIGGRPGRRQLLALKQLYGGIFAEQTCKRAGLWLYAMLVARLGTADFAAHQIGMNCLTLCFAVGDGLSIAVVSLIGQSLGQERPGQAREYLRLCQRVGLCCSALFSLVFFTMGRQIYRLFVDDPHIQDLGVRVLYIAAAVVFLQITQVIYFGCLRGAGDARFIAVVTFLSISVLRPALGYVLCYGAGWGLYGAWLALVAEQASRLALSWYRIHQGGWVRLKI